MEGKDQFEPRGQGLLVRAPAKVNLSLLIAGKRPDGYHQIETLMAKINVYDEILIEPGPSPQIELACTGPHWAPDGADNLVYRAARLLLDTCGRDTGLRITLTKNLPAGSGLGTASSDAATTLLGVRYLLGLQVSTVHLAGLAAQLGSDVAFFLGGPLAMCTGRGEEVQPVETPHDFLAIVVLPAISVSTASVYRRYRHDEALYVRWHTEIQDHLSRNRIDLITRMCANMLTQSSFSKEEGLSKLKQRIESLGIGPMCLSGSGSAMYCVIDRGDPAEARRIQSILTQEIHCDCLIVTNNRW